MSTHPNVILLLVLTPDGLSRKTRREILAENSADDVEGLDRDIKIGSHSYHHEVMEDDYSEGYQISADEGDIIIFDFITYGYGGKIIWEELEVQKKELEKWAVEICEQHNCSHKIFITANYW